MKIVISFIVFAFGFAQAPTDEGMKRINGTNLYIKKFGAGKPGPFRGLG